LNSIAWDNKFNPSVELIYNQRNKITECMTLIRNQVADMVLNKDQINDLLDQLKQLCQMHFSYVENLLTELNYTLVIKQKHLHDSFVEAVDGFKITFNQCDAANIYSDFTELRLNFISTMCHMTMILRSFMQADA